jgi:hypothetical protein
MDSTTRAIGAFGEECCAAPEEQKAESLAAYLRLLGAMADMMDSARAELLLLTLSIPETPQ